MERYPTSEGIELNRFKTISDFKWCVNCGGEIEFEWKGKGDQNIKGQKISLFFYTLFLFLQQTEAALVWAASVCFEQFLQLSFYWYGFTMCGNP